MNILTKLLFQNADEEYKKFSEKLIPDTSYPIIGVRTPIVKNIAKTSLNDTSLIHTFLNSEHEFYEEWLLHGLLIAYNQTDIEQLFNDLNAFLPHVDNWAICDCTVSALKQVKKHYQLFYNQIKIWLKSKKSYVVRFAIVLLLSYYLDNSFDDEILILLKNVKSDHYYINMALAWFYSIALIKQYDKTIKIIENKNLPYFVHNKSIQKALESFRITDEKKKYLRSLKIQKPR